MEKAGYAGSYKVCSVFLFKVPYPWDLLLLSVAWDVRTWMVWFRFTSAKFCLFRRTTKYKICNGSGELEITLMDAQCFGRPTGKANIALIDPICVTVEKRTRHCWKCYVPFDKGFGFWRGQTLSLVSLGCVIMLHNFLFSRFAILS